MKRHTHNPLKIMASTLAVISLFAFTALTQVQATHNPNPTIVHGSMPEVRSGEHMRDMRTGQMTGVTVHSNNMSNVGFSTTVCAESMHNGVAHHLGCIPSIPYNSTGQAGSAFDFNVWPANMSGTHSMAFTYRDMNGNWQTMMSPTHTPVTATIMR